MLFICALGRHGPSSHNHDVQKRDALKAWTVRRSKAEQCVEQCIYFFANRHTHFSCVNGAAWLRSPTALALNSDSDQ